MTWVVEQLNSVICQPFQESGVQFNSRVTRVVDNIDHWAIINFLPKKSIICQKVIRPIKGLTTFQFSQQFTHIKVFLDQFVIIQMCFKYFYTENILLCRWCLLTGYISAKRLKRLLEKRWRLGSFQAPARLFSHRSLKAATALFQTLLIQKVSRNRRNGPILIQKVSRNRRNYRFSVSRHF